MPQERVRHRRNAKSGLVESLNETETQHHDLDSAKAKRIISHPLARAHPRCFGWIILVTVIALLLWSSTILLIQETLQKGNHPLHMPTKGYDSSPFSIYIKPQNASVPTKLQHNITRQLQCDKPYLTLPLMLDNNDQDPTLPWIHDYFVDSQSKTVRFVAQNKRRCFTGKNRASVMKFWEPQMALFQPVAVSKQAENNYILTDPEQADFPETRFVCRFHVNTKDNNNQQRAEITFSQYSFNYEYINWRKRGELPMFEKDGPDVKIFDYSTLLFQCPIPKSMQDLQNQKVSLQLDLIPIVTPARYNEGVLLTEDHVGPNDFRKLRRFRQTPTAIPPLDTMARLENLPICPSSASSVSSIDERRISKQHTLVACTWAAAHYARRGGRSTVKDAPLRLKEWLAFHQLAGYDHIYVFDNTHQQHHSDNDFPLKEVTDQFSKNFVTWIEWPANVCNNNFVGGRWPGERSSQFAAEATCRERFGPQTEFMSFMDTDEYMLPIQNKTWPQILAQRKEPVLAIRESRAKPRQTMMDITTDSQICTHLDKEETYDSDQVKSKCFVSRRNETFLATYNCDSVKPPRPFHYFTNMKQIYRTDFVLSHFVHYAVVTRDIAETYKEKNAASKHFARKPAQREKGIAYLDERNEATMMHTRSILPFETSNFERACVHGSKEDCKVGFECPSTTKFDDKLVGKNAFLDDNGNYCNCWRNSHVDKWIPLLDSALQMLHS